MKTILFLAAAVIMNAFANISIKVGVNHFGQLGQSSLAETVRRVLLNPWLILGVALFVGALGAYSVVLSKMNLSIAYPLMTSLGFIIVTIFSFLVFKETISGLQLLGLLVILGGIWLVSNP